MFKEFKILRIFFENPSRDFNVREVARILKLSPATTSKELKKLAKKGVLKKREERILNLYKSNIDNILYRDLKIFYNIRKIRDSGLIEELNKFYLKPTIVLFGSSSNGFDTENSDIDLLILSEKTKVFENLKKFEKKINRKIQLFVVKKLKDLKNEHLMNSVINGIVIQGELKWT